MGFIAFILGIAAGLAMQMEIETDDFKFKSKSMLDNFFLKTLNNKVDTVKPLMYSDDCSYLERTNLSESAEIVGNREGFEMWMISNKLEDEGLVPSEYKVLDVLDKGTYSIMSYCGNYLFGIKFVGDEPKPFYVKGTTSGYSLEEIEVVNSIKEAMEGNYNHTIFRI